MAIYADDEGDAKCEATNMMVRRVVWCGATTWYMITSLEPQRLDQSPDDVFVVAALRMGMGSREWVHGNGSNE